MTLNASDLSDFITTLVFSNKISTPLQTGAMTGRSLSMSEIVSFLDSVLVSIPRTGATTLSITNNCSHKDLGIVMSADLSWRKHYYLISSHAYRTLGLLHCTFNTCNQLSLCQKAALSILGTLTNHLLLCHLAPSSAERYIHVGENPKRTTKFILNNYTFMTIDHVSNFTPTSPSDDGHFLCQIAKLYYQRLSICEKGARSSTRHKLKQSASCTNKTEYFYFNRLPRLWNSLPTIDLNQPLPTITSMFQTVLLEPLPLQLRSP